MELLFLSEALSDLVERLRAEGKLFSNGGDGDGGNGENGNGNRNWGGR